MGHDPALFEKNFTALRPWFDETLRSAIDECTAFDLEILRDDTTGEFENIKVGGREFYPKAAPLFARKQVEAFSGSPQTVDFSQAIHQNVQNQSQGLWDHSGEGKFVVAHLAHLKGVPVPGAANTDYVAGFFISFGLGSGQHLSHILDKFKFKDLIVCEGYLDFLLLSMHVIDWAVIADKVASRGGRIHFILNSNPSSILRGLNRIIQTSHIGLIEGSYLFQHHNFDPIDKAVASLPELLRQAIQYNGWLEDEATHMRHILANRKYNRDAAYLTPNARARFENPIVIVGSGPSLEKSLPQLKKYQNKVIVVSCGTALRILLKAGIQPDFHCEIENIVSLEEIFKDMAGEFDLRPITFIASYTVAPTLPQFFYNTIFFPREGDSLSSLLFDTQIELSGRTSTISALSIFMRLEATNIVLMGVDFALGENKETHSKDTIYESDQERFGRGSGNDKDFISVAGNQRKTVQSNTTWSYMRYGMEMAVMHHAAHGSPSKLWNNGDGAAIENIPPLSMNGFVELCEKLPDKNKASTPGNALFDQLRNSQISGSIVTSGMHDAYDAFLEIANLSKETLEFVEETDDFVQQYERFYTHFLRAFSELAIADRPGKQQPVWRVFHPIILQAFHYINHRLRRMDTQSRQRWTAIYIVEFFKFFDVILCRLNAEFDELIRENGITSIDTEQFTVTSEVNLARFFLEAWRNPLSAIGLLDSVSLAPTAWRYTDMVIYKRLLFWRTLFALDIMTDSGDYLSIRVRGRHLHVLKYALLACSGSSMFNPIPTFPERLLWLPRNIRSQATEEAVQADTKPNH